MANPIDVAKYLIFRGAFDGEAITNLKMQKLLYFVYVWTLVLTKEKLFEEGFEAWCNGPVLRTVYNELRTFGGGPIDISFSGLKEEKELDELKKKIGLKFIEVIDEVYNAYGDKTAFELVRISHNSLAWQKARGELNATETSSNLILDEDILAQYAEKA